MAKHPPPRIPGLIDAHCHLDHAPMADDVQATLDRAAAAGVEQVVHIGCSRQSHARALAISDAHPQVSLALGIHPHEGDTVDDDAIAALRAFAARDDVVAIGETGLDYYYDRAAREAQREGFARHIALARELDLPLVLHIRDAHDEALALARSAPLPSRPGMVHCFTGTPAEMDRWLDLGFLISFSGIATFPKATELREAATHCPADRLMLETDAPYLAPVPVRGRRNEPANVAHTCANLAALRGEDPLELAGRATENTRALLGL